MSHFDEEITKRCHRWLFDSNLYLFHIREFQNINISSLTNKLLKKVQKQSLTPPPLQYFHDFVRFHQYINPFSGIKFKYNYSSRDIFRFHHSVNFNPITAKIGMSEKCCNYLIKYKPIEILCDDDSRVLMKCSRIGDSNTINFVWNNFKSDLIFVNFLGNRDKEPLLEFAYYKTFREPFDILSFHFKASSNAQTFSLQSSLSRGNYIGFEAIHTKDNIDIHYKYSFLFSNFIKGLKLAGTYFKNDIYLDLIYKFNHKSALLLNYKVNEFSFEEKWLLGLKIKNNIHSIVLTTDENLNKFHILHKLRLTSYLNLYSSAEIYPKKFPIGRCGFCIEYSNDDTIP